MARPTKSAASFPALDAALQTTIEALASPVRREILWLVWDAERAALRCRCAAPPFRVRAYATGSSVELDRLGLQLPRSCAAGVRRGPQAAGYALLASRCALLQSAACAPAVQAIDTGPIRHGSQMVKVEADKAGGKAASGSCATR